MSDLAGLHFNDPTSSRVGQKIFHVSLLAVHAFRKQAWGQQLLVCLSLSTAKAPGLQRSSQQWAERGGGYLGVSLRPPCRFPFWDGGRQTRCSGQKRLQEALASITGD